MNLLDRLLAIYQETDPQARAEAMRAALTPDQDLSGLRDAAVARFEELSSGEQTDDTLTQMEGLAEVAELAVEQLGTPPVPGATPEQTTTQAPPAAPAVPAPPQVPEAPGTPAAPGAGDNAGTGAGTADPPQVPAQAPSPENDPASAAASPPAQPAAQPVAASGRTIEPTSVQPGTAARSATERASTALSAWNSSRLPDTNTAETRWTAYAAADIPDVPAGAELRSLDDLAEAMVARMQGLARLGPGRSAQAGIATLRRPAHPDFTYSGEQDSGCVERACDERRLPGGNLVAASGGTTVPAGVNRGWCAPSETLYDLCPTASLDGMVDLPEVVTRRGGIRYPTPPNFSTLYQGKVPSPPYANPPQTAEEQAKIRGWHFTEQEVPTKRKPCYEIPCLGLLDVRLDVDGLCLISPILTERGWPELVQYFMAQALAAHAHRINAWKLARMVTLVNAPNVINIPAPDATTGVDPFGPGAVPTVLSAIELYVEQVRYTYRLGENATLEMVAPRWLKGILRSDLSKRQGVENMLSVTDAQLNAHLAMRGVRVQWVVDWQDSYGLTIGGTPEAPTIGDPTGLGLGGDITALKTWPGKASVLLYPAGTYFAMHADVLTIDGLYDAQQLEQNLYTKLWTEEGLNVAKRCYEPLMLNFELCPNGLTGGGVERICVAPPPPAEAAATEGETGGETAQLAAASTGGSGSGSGSSRKK